MEDGLPVAEPERELGQWVGNFSGERANLVGTTMECMSAVRSSSGRGVVLGNSTVAKATFPNSCFLVELIKRKPI